MKRKYLIVLIASLFLGCSKENDEVKKDATNFKVSLDEAKLVATNAVQFLNKGSNKKLLKKHVVNAVTATYEGNPSYHIFNYVEGGFAIISADKRITPILAYSEDSNYDINDNNKPLGLTIWENATKELLSVSQKFSSVDKAVQAEWEELEGSNSNSSKRVEPPTDGGGTTVTQVGPLLKTRWGQGCFYNDFTPQYTGSKPENVCYHQPAGCVSVSMGQIMYYHRFPLNFDYNYMSWYWGSSETSRLFKEIGDRVGMTYTDDGGSAKGENIGGTFVAMGYSRADYMQKYNHTDYQVILNNLDVNQPVILNGFLDENTFLGFPLNGIDGHSWVCDGYIRRRTNSSTTLVLHMNWGWDGRADGWFHYNNWEFPYPGTGEIKNFKYFNSAIVNIKP